VKKGAANMTIIKRLWNRVFRKACPTFKTRPFSELRDRLDYDRRHPRPWYTKTYNSLRYFFKHTIGTPRDWYKEVKWFIQRGRRGWADRDTWSLDWYLSGWMPDALRHLKNTKHGVPSAMFEGEDCATDGNPSEEGMARASARWDAAMDKMIAAFEAHRRMGDFSYEEELGEYQFSRPIGVSVDAWEKLSDERHDKQQLLIKRDELIEKEGLELFVKHFHSLWD
jgi:hypothetical protein